jgi:hypothetical protein
MIVYGLVSLGAFAAALTMLREFHREDLNYFLSILNLRELWKYFLTEMKLGRGKKGSA